MAYELPNLSSTGGIEVVGAELARQIQFFWSGILFLIYMVIWGVGSLTQRDSVRASNTAMWAAIAGLITTSGGFILFLYDNLIGLESLIISVIVTIISVAAFLLSDRQ